LGNYVPVAMSQSAVWEVVSSGVMIIGFTSSKATANLPGSKRITFPEKMTFNFFLGGVRRFSRTQP